MSHGEQSRGGRETGDDAGRAGGPASGEPRVPDEPGELDIQEGRIRGQGGRRGRIQTKPTGGPAGLATQAAPPQHRPADVPPPAGLRPPHAGAAPVGHAPPDVEPSHGPPPARYPLGPPF